MARWTATSRFPSATRRRQRRRRCIVPMYLEPCGWSSAHGVRTPQRSGCPCWEDSGTHVGMEFGLHVCYQTLPLTARPRHRECPLLAIQGPLRAKCVPDVPIPRPSASPSDGSRGPRRSGTEPSLASPVLSTALGSQAGGGGTVPRGVLWVSPLAPPPASQLLRRLNCSAVWAKCGPRPRGTWSRGPARQRMAGAGAAPTKTPHHVRPHNVADRRRSARCPCPGR